MNIGEAARASGINAKMIRYYESVGLVGPAHRSDNGYRVYSDAEVHMLRFIKRARALGFSMTQIEQLVRLWRDQHRSSAEVKRVAQEHIDELQQKIDELEGMKRTLEHLARHCHGDHRPDCPIIDDLAGEEQQPRLSSKAS